MASSSTRVMAWAVISLVVAAVAAVGFWYGRRTVSYPTDVHMTKTSEDQSDALSEMNLIVPADQITDLMQRATAGDNDAASRLAGHYSQIGETDREIQWLMLAANRGHCASMSQLMEKASQRRDSNAAARWNESLRNNECTWGKTYPGASDPEMDSVPLWNVH